MKKISILLIGATLSLVACGSNENHKDDPIVDPSNPQSELFNTLVTNLKSSHNYSIHINSSLVEDVYEEAITYNRYMIDNKAWFTDESEYGFAYSGIIYQKNQGYVYFDMPSTTVVPGDFYSVVTSKGYNELDDVIGENLFIGEYVQDSSDLNKFTSTSIDNRTVLAYMTQYYQYIGYNFEVDDTLYASLNSENNEITLSMKYWILDAATHEKYEGDISATIKNIGSTHNTAIESYINNPTYTYPIRNAWNNDDIKLFNELNNKVIPTFPSGMSYAFSCKKDIHEGKYNVTVTDKNSGDISTSYGNTLVNEGYTKNGNVYKKVVPDSSSGVSYTYYVELAYKEGNILFPNGIMNIYYRVAFDKGVFGSINELNEYFSMNRYDELFPLLPESSECSQITDFNDSTVRETAYAVAINKSGFFKIHFSTYNAALSWYDSYVLLLEANDYSDISEGPTQTTYSFDNGTSIGYGTMVRFATLSQTNYQGYIQMSVVVAKEDEALLRSRHSELVSISVSNYKTNWFTNDTFRFDGVVTATYSNGSSRVVIPTSVSTPDMSTVGEKTVTISYKEKEITKTTSYTINVLNNTKTVTSISLGGVYAKQFKLNSVFIHAGMSITASYSDGSTAIVSNAVTFTGYNTTVLGKQTVTVSYTYNGVTVTTSYEIIVKETLSFPTLSVSNGSGYDYWFIDSYEDDIETFNYNEHNYFYLIICGLYGEKVNSVSIINDPNAQISKITDDYYESGYTQFKIIPTINLEANEISLTIEGAPISNKYTVSADTNIEGGMIVLTQPSVSGTLCEVGDIIRFTTKANSGYTLENVFIKNHPEFEIEESINPFTGGVAYLFEMPAFNVVISASFISSGPVETHKVSEDTNLAHGSVVFISPSESGMEVDVGSTVSFGIDCDEDYDVENVFIVDHNEITIENSTNIVTKKVTYSFTMPDFDVVISATFKNKTYTITADVVSGGKIELIHSVATSGQTAAFKLTPNEGYELISYGVKNHPEIAVNTSVNPISGVTTYNFEMPKFDVTVTATFKKISGGFDPYEVLASHGIYELADENDPTKICNIVLNEDGTGTQLTGSTFSQTTYSFNYEVIQKSDYSYEITISNVTKISGSKDQGTKISNCTSWTFTINSGLDIITEMELTIYSAALESYYIFSL